LESLALTIKITKKHKSKGGKATHTRLKFAAKITHTREEVSTQHNAKSLQLESAQILRTMIRMRGCRV
jgi:hypothetical protein